LAKDTAAIRKNADHLRSLLEKRGITARLLELEGMPPGVYGERRQPGARRTVLFYSHYDGQPVRPSAWHGDPWTPLLRDRPLDQGGREIDWRGGAPLPPEGRLYGRSTSDDKGPIVAMFAALDALAAAGLSPTVNLKFFFEGEEEAGSPHLEAFLRRYTDVLDADVWLLCDGPVHQSRRMQVYFGARGVFDLEMTVYGPARSLHSGHYGNWAPNPAVELAHLLAGLRDRDGRILVPGFDAEVRPLTAAEQRALAAVPDIDDALRQELALPATEAGNARLVERILRPALNVRGVSSGGVGAEAANAIATEARASIDFRLVPDQTPESVRRHVEAHLKAQGYTVVHDAPSLEVRRATTRLVHLGWGPGYPGARTSLDLPASRAVVAAVEECIGGPVIQLPSLGGSIGWEVFARVLDRPIIGVPIVNHDNNQHAADENVRLQNLWDGIEVFAGLMLRLDPLWPAR
jgi:acetylornithine deacetylase/succinyl-diaminopimelate desuccinylase-like protein